jgi:hypothetical protein
VSTLPSYHVAPMPEGWQHNSPKDWNWAELPSLPPFILADGSTLARQQTQVRVCYSGYALYVHFDCTDDDIWGTYTKRGSPIYDEEVVEVFIAAGHDIPTRYFEFEVSPYGVLFDCVITNPSRHPEEPYDVDERWNAEGLEWYAEAYPEKQHWWATLILPWHALGGYQAVWRANFYRIERSQRSGTELSCWSPTFSKSFHVPARFGILVFENIIA